MGGFGCKLGVDITGFCVDIDKNRDGLFKKNDVGGSHKREGAGYNIITRANSGSSDAEVKAGSARINRQRMAASGKIFECRFEGLNLRPHAQIIMVEYR